MQVRTAHILAELKQTASATPHAQALMDELVGFLSYYTDHIEFISTMIGMLGSFFFNRQAFQIRVELMKSVLETVARACRQHMGDLSLVLVRFLWSSLNGQLSDWDEQFMRWLLDTEAHQVIFFLVDSSDTLFREPTPLEPSPATMTREMLMCYVYAFRGIEDDPDIQDLIPQVSARLDRLNYLQFGYRPTRARILPR